MRRFQSLSRTVLARLNCIQSNNTEWRDRHEETILSEVRDTAPSGSGIDSGTTIDLDASTGDKLVFTAGYHHMNDGGMYDGWTEHTFTVRPCLAFGFSLTISGRDRNGVKEYLSDIFHEWLNEVIDESPLPVTPVIPVSATIRS